MTATRLELENLGADILTNAYEGGSYGLASWAVADSTYMWGTEDGGKEYASVVLYEREEQPDSRDEYDLTKPLFISEVIIADFIEALGTGKYVYKGADYGDLSTETKARLMCAYLLGADGIELFQQHDDALVSDAICQTILLGEVRYG